MTLVDGSSSADEAAAPRNLILRITAILVMLYGPTSPLLESLLRISCLTMLLVPGLLIRPFVWWGTLAAMVGCYAPEWFSIDNHKYLMTYWVFACALSLSAGADLRSASRALLAAVFCLATAWKLIGGEYTDGSFLYVAFLTEPRLIPFGAMLSGGAPDAFMGLEAIRYALLEVRPSSVVHLPVFTGLAMTTLLFSWVGLLLEGTIATLHLVPARWAYQIRHRTLMCFILVTYGVFPITGFAFTLVVLGLAGCEAADARNRMAYIAIAAVVQLTLVPWRVLLP